MTLEELNSSIEPNTILDSDLDSVPKTYYIMEEILRQSILQGPDKILDKKFFLEKFGNTELNLRYINQA